MINDDYVGDYSDDDLKIDELEESEGESEKDDAYEAGGDD